MQFWPQSIIITLSLLLERNESERDLQYFHRVLVVLSEELIKDDFVLSQLEVRNAEVFPGAWCCGVRGREERKVRGREEIKVRGR